MFKKLAVLFLVLTLSALGACGSDNNNTAGSGGRSGGGGAGSGGAGSGGAGTGGTGSGAAGTGGVDAAMEAGGDVTAEVAADVSGEVVETGGETTADICGTLYPNSSGRLPVAVADFCARYETVCGFTGTDRYTSAADCIAKYTDAAAEPECRAYHLCNAATMAGAARAMHCEHATGASICK
jgi:hypothetical protein